MKMKTGCKNFGKILYFHNGVVFHNYHPLFNDFQFQHAGRASVLGHFAAELRPADIMERGELRPRDPAGVERIHVVRATPQLLLFQLLGPSHQFFDPRLGLWICRTVRLPDESRWWVSLGGRWRLSKEAALPYDLWGMLYDGWTPNPEEGTSVFLQGLDR